MCLWDIGCHNVDYFFICTSFASNRNLSLKLNADYWPQVTDYLLKRGFNRTEEVFRQESKHLGPDGKPIQQLANIGPKKYQKAFKLLKEWVDNNLELYKVSLHVSISCLHFHH